MPRVVMQHFFIYSLLLKYCTRASLDIYVCFYTNKKKHYVESVFAYIKTPPNWSVVKTGLW